MADYWDQPGLTWDSGLTWDAGTLPSPGDVSPYLALVTSEHNQKPDYMTMLEQTLQPFADQAAVMNNTVTLFDINTALGIQLDVLGLWIGRTRTLTVPISGVWFTLDIGPGLDQGVLISPFDSTTYLYSLPDEPYRNLLKATIAANHWDGTTFGAYEATAIVFGPGGFRYVIIDNQDMTMDVVLAGPVPDAVTLALFIGGYLNLKPVGVRIANYITNGSPLTNKIFMLDAPPDSDVFGGLDQAALANFYEGT